MPLRKENVEYFKISLGDSEFSETFCCNTAPPPFPKRNAQFPTAAAGRNHLRKANNNFSDGLTNLKWAIFLRKQRMFDASFRPRA